MKNKHTPGPWIAHACYGRGTSTDLFGLWNSVASVDGFNIAQCQDDIELAVDWEERQEIVRANTFLVAAAPELLEALETLCQPGKTTPEDFFKDFEKARAVIAKAKGEKP